MPDGTDRLTPGAAATRSLEDVAAWVAAGQGAAPAERWSEDLAERIAASASAAQAAEARLSTLLAAEPLLERIQDRYGTTGAGAFAGRIHEFHHATTFNADAAAKGLGDQIRAFVTEWEGASPDPHAAADVVILDGASRVVDEVQSKAVESLAARAHDLASERYRDMQLVVPSDHVQATSDFIDRRVSQADADFLKHGAYLDAQSRLTDQIRLDGVASQPLTADQLRAASADPDGYLRSLQQREESILGHEAAVSTAASQAAVMAEVAQVAGAALAAGVTASLVNAAVGATVQGARLLAGTATPSEASLRVVSDSAAAFARGAFVGGAGQAASLAASHGVLPEALGAGALPFACARATWDLADAARRYATGEIDGQEAAARSAQSLCRVSFTYAGSVVGQAIIPIPVVGSLVGGVVGGLCAGITIQAASIAIHELRALGVEREQLAILQMQVAETVALLDAEVQWLAKVSADWDIVLEETVVPALDGMLDAFLVGDYAAAVPKVAQVLQAYESAPLFGTWQEFDAWMQDPETTLVLDPNPTRH